MNTETTYPSRLRLLLDFGVIFAIGLSLKIALDLVIWRYSGPASLAIMLVIVFAYMRRRGHKSSWIGLASLASRRDFLWLIPQILLAFIAILATGLGIGTAGEALGIDFMTPDPTGAENRFGDLAGNTPLYLFWLAILWFAGPAEELYFRGFMIGQIRDSVGKIPGATFLSIFIPAVLFGFGHMYYQGLRGLFITGGIGLVLGALYIMYKRNIWPLMIAHAAVNTLTFTAMYMQWDI